MSVSYSAGDNTSGSPILGPVQGRMLPAAPMYGQRPADAPLVDLVFLGRVSDEDLQDPTLSIPRQLASCQAVLPPGARIVGYYWDVESGRIHPDFRGRSRAARKVYGTGSAGRRDT